MTKQFLFVHGYKGTPDTPPWFKWTAQILQKEKNVVSSIPAMPFPSNPNMDAWLQVIFRAAREQEFPNTTFVGHSLGGAALLRAIEMSAEPAAHVILVATPFEHIKRYNIGAFFQTPWDFEALKKKALRFTCIYSKDDPAVPYEHGLKFAQELGADLITFEDKGHFDELLEFPEFVYNILLKNE